jgi:hypothetical protein
MNIAITTTTRILDWLSLLREPDISSITGKDSGDSESSDQSSSGVGVGFVPSFGGLGSILQELKELGNQLSFLAKKVNAMRLDSSSTELEETELNRALSSLSRIEGRLGSISSKCKKCGINSRKITGTLAHYQYRRHMLALNVVKLAQSFTKRLRGHVRQLNSPAKPRKSPSPFQLKPSSCHIAA